MALPSTLSASLHLLWIRNILRKTNVLRAKTRMLLNAIASLIWQYVFLMFLPAKTQVQHLRASFTEALPGARLSGWFCKDRNLRRGFWLVSTQTWCPLCKIVLQIQIRSDQEEMYFGGHKAVSLLNLQSHIYICMNWFPNLFVPRLLSLPVCSTKSTSKMCQHYLLQDHVRHMLRDL